MRERTERGVGAGVGPEPLGPLLEGLPDALKIRVQAQRKDPPALVGTWAEILCIIVTHGREIGWAGASDPPVANPTPTRPRAGSRSPPEVPAIRRERPAAKTTAPGVSGAVSHTLPTDRVIRPGAACRVSGAAAWGSAVGRTLRRRRSPVPPARGGGTGLLGSGQRPGEEKRTLRWQFSSLASL